MQPQMSDSEADDLATCRAMLCDGSRTFLAAARVLPASVHRPATSLYAFCRQADDAIDCAGGGARALGPLHDRLDHVYAGRPLQMPADRALARVVARHSVPRALLEALLDGFAWDAQGRRYDTLSGLFDYCARVAGTVGAMMAALMDARDPAVVARACDLGVAMQLTNIARDVGEDARAGRLYLPRDWLRQAGIAPEKWLANPVFTPALGDVVQRLLAIADALYARADTGIGALPLACRPGIGAARRLYAEIGAEVARQGYDSVSRRAVVSGSRKAALLARSLTSALPAALDTAPPLPEVAFLVDAVAATRRPKTTAPSILQTLDARAGWLIELFARLEQRDQLERPVP